MNINLILMGKEINLALSFSQTGLVINIVIFCCVCRELCLIHLLKYDVHVATHLDNKVK